MTTSRTWKELVGTGSLTDFSWINDWDTGLLESDIFDFSTAGKIVDELIRSPGDAKIVWYLYRLEFMCRSCRSLFLILPSHL